MSHGVTTKKKKPFVTFFSQNVLLNFDVILR